MDEPNDVERREHIARTRILLQFFFPPNKLKNFVKEGKQLNNLSPKPENHPSTDAPIWDHLWGLQIINL